LLGRLRGAAPGAFKNLSIKRLAQEVPHQQRKRPIALGRENLQLAPLG
jgi:hypothetical protein